MATSAQIGNLNVRLAMDTAQFAAGVKTVQSSLGTLGTAFKAFAASAAVNFLGQMGLAAVRAGAQIGDLAETIGITAEQVQVFNRLAVASGSSSESMAKGLQSIAEQSVDAESKLSKLFAANGIAAQGMAVNDVIRTFTDLLKNARNPAEQLAIATEVLGTRVGRDLIEALRTGAAGYDDAMQSMIASGELMSNAEIKRLQELETQYNLVTDRIGAYWMKMVVGIAESTAGLGSQFMGFRESVQQSIWGTTDAQMGPRTSGPGSMGGPNEFATPSNPVPVKVTNMPAPEKKAATGKSSASPSWRSGSSENPMQGGPVTGYDLRGNGLVIDELTTDLQQANTAAYDLAESITDTLGSALVGLANGTMSFKDAFSSMAQSLLSDLADITSQLLKSAAASAPWASAASAASMPKAARSAPASGASRARTARRSSRARPAFRQWAAARRRSISTTRAAARSSSASGAARAGKTSSTSTFAASHATKPSRRSASRCRASTARPRL
jgi:hypothetical protein